MTTVLVLVILGLIWAAVLLPPYLQNRREHRPGDSIASFRHQLSVLERATPEGRARSIARIDAGYHDAPHHAPPAVAAYRARRPASARPSAAGLRRAEVRRRRRDVLVSLLAAVGLTLLLAVVTGSAMMWMLHLVVDLAFVGFVTMLVKLQQESAEKDLKVRFLEPTPLRSVEQPILRRVGS